MSAVEKPKKPSAKRSAEDQLASILAMADAPLSHFARQHHYVPGRRLAADFAWPEQKVIVEIQGGVFNRKAHGSVTGVLADMERGNLATLHGWRVLRFLPKDVTDEARRREMLDLIRMVISDIYPTAVERRALPLAQRFSEAVTRMHAAEERATQAEGQREALRVALEDIARNASKVSAWWIGKVAREALSPSTEATPSEEK